MSAFGFDWLLLLQFDALVAALPLSEGGEEAQLKRIVELQVWLSLTVDGACKIINGFLGFLLPSSVAKGKTNYYQDSVAVLLSVPSVLPSHCAAI